MAVLHSVAISSFARHHDMALMEMTEYEAPTQVLIFVCLLCFSSSLLFRLTITYIRK